MGIGYGGKTLEQMLEENERLFREIGHYYGIKELELRKEDPLKYERLYSRLLSLAIGARESVRFIASSPGTREVGELVFALFTPEGDGIVFSTGIMAHVQTMSQFIKWLIRNKFEENPGVVEGRYFENNDWWAGGLHPVDVLQVTPIFWKGELVGWSGGVIHELDAGAFQPIGCPQSPTRFVEGYHLMGDTIAENDELGKVYVEKAKLYVRFPELFIMDAKVRLSGNYMIREGVKKAIEEYGIEYYIKAIGELIEEGRRAFTEKVKRLLIPGKYRSTAFLPLPYKKVEGMRLLHPLAQEDMLLHLPIEITVREDGTLSYEFDGASPQGPHACQATLALLRGGLWITLTQILAYDLRVSHGMNLCVEIKAPPGSVLNPTDRHTSTAMVWNTLSTLFTAGTRLLSNAFFSRGFLEEVFMMNSNCLHGIGMLDPKGGLAGGDNLELSNAGSGARAVADGLDGGYCLWLPDTTAGNAESWESLYPELYLSRDFLRDAYAPGRFRGGVSWNAVFTVWDTDFMYVVLRCGWTCGGLPVDKGLFGGYPSPASFGFVLKDTNIRGLIQRGEDLPRSVYEVLEFLKNGKLKADEVYFYKTHDSSPNLKTYDMFGLVYTGGAGYGDPIDRDPELVRIDVEKGFVSPERGEKIHAVVLRLVGNEWKVDLAATEERRKAVRKERLQRVVPVKEFIDQQRERVLSRKLSEHVTRCYRDCMRISAKFRREFYEFWNLPEDFKL